MSATTPQHQPGVKPSSASAGEARIPARRFSAIHLLVALVLMIVLTPFVQELPLGQVIEITLLSVVLVTAVLAVGGKRGTVVVGIVLAVTAAAGKWINHFRPDWVTEEVFLSVGLVFMAFVAIHLLQFIMRAPRVTTEVVCAGVSGYLLLGILWTLAYLMVARTTPSAFAVSSGPATPLNGQAISYFSFITLTTVGYGDIVPVAPVARMLATLEAITGTFYMAVLVARLVAMHSTSQPASDDHSSH